MRDILKKVTTGSMIAGAALLVAACGGDNAANNTATDMGNDVSMDTNMGDMGLDANMTTDANMGMDANMSTDMNTTTTTTTTETNTTTNAQ
jgi:hypothetical protein